MSRSLWSGRTTGTVTATTALAAVVLAAAWYQISGTTRTDDQMRWIVISLVAVGAAVGSQAVLILTGLRSVGAANGIAPPRNRVRAETAASTVDGAGSFVSGPTMTLYHRSTCPFVVGKPSQPSAVATHEAQGRRPCDVCLP